MRSLILQIADVIFDIEKPVYALLYSSSRDEYKIKQFTDHVLDNWMKHLSSEDEDWHIIMFNQSEDKLYKKIPGIIERRHERDKRRQHESSS